MNLYLVNGFLGSGKTTAIANACKQLIDKKIKAAVITNDQGAQQVDSGYIRSLSLPNAEIANGCFCCRYDKLEETIEALKITEQPDIIFAESVGSCTDLVATVAKPFALHQSNARIVVNVFADAYLMHSIIKGTSCFIEESVQYIYRKQLEEADVIVINKTDLLEKDELKSVRDMIEESYPAKEIIYMNAHSENDISNWRQALESFVIPANRKSLELDYDLYGAGEAMLGWLDQKISLHTHEPIAVKVGLFLCDMIFNKIKQAGYTIGHLKFLLSEDNWGQKISYTTTGIAEEQHAELHQCNHLDMLINARVQTSHDLLEQIVTGAIEETMALTGCRIVTHQSAAFQPGYPKPLHRISV